MENVEKILNAFDHIVYGSLWDQVDYSICCTSTFTLVKIGKKSYLQQLFPYPPFMSKTVTKT